ncbi:MAG: SgcJ/EcaC family oxidoreductase [Vicinamibacterales bacterium]
MKDLPNTERSRLEEVIQAWNIAAANWDPRKLADIYAEDAVLFGGLPGQSVGRSGIFKYFSAYVGQILTAKLALYETEIRPLGSASILVQGFCCFEFILDGGKRTTSELRASWIIEWTGEKTCIRAHHFSPTPPSPPLGNK